jgi:hypothetical protein
VDYFKTNPTLNKPVASFLSHVHSDHLVGLEDPAYSGPIVYCSHATRNLLLNLQAKGNQISTHVGGTKLQKYQHLRKELCGAEMVKPLTLNYPHKILINPGEYIQVTLIDSDHCPGSVMFLFESNNNAVLYTGDLRAEKWYINSLSHHPSLASYYNGMTHLDCMYVDTTFTYRGTPYIDIPPNMYGIRSLLALLEKYPDDTLFVFNTLTIGYELVWVAIASRFKTLIHVDPYLFNLYQCIAPQSNDLIGRVLVDNCLTTNETATRFHACQKLSGCSCRRRNDVVFITPVVNKSQKAMDAYNGGQKLANFKIFQLHNPLSSSQENIPQEPDDIAEDAVFVCNFRRHIMAKDKEHVLPATLQFYFSRHGSYAEIKRLVKAFRPRQVKGIFTPQNDSRDVIDDLFDDAIYKPLDPSPPLAASKRSVVFPLFGGGKPRDQSIIAISDQASSTKMPQPNSQNSNSLDSVTRSAILTMLNRSAGQPLTSLRKFPSFEPIDTIDSLSITKSTGVKDYSNTPKQELTLEQISCHDDEQRQHLQPLTPPIPVLSKRRRVLSPGTKIKGKEPRPPGLQRKVAKWPLRDNRLKQNLTILRSFYEGNLEMESISIDSHRVNEIASQLLASNSVWWHKQRFIYSNE